MNVVCDLLGLMRYGYIIVTLYYFSWTKLYFVAFNSQWQSASEVDSAFPLAREEVVRLCTDQPELWSVYALSAVPAAN